ncbi:MAG TPA: hypothetical protein VK689_01505, partial [Armatimonadota bacterium]|nr:hypothetical protein [Armatimonadota bacterium]
LPASAQTQKSPFEGDARLDKPVTVRWKKTTLYEALQEVSRATGVRLNPDRALVDEPLMASATRLPARALLEQIGRLLHFTWVRTGGKPEAPVYLLFQDRVARQEEEDAINGAQRAVLQALEAELERYRRIGRLSPEQLDRELEKANAEAEATLAGGLASAGSSPAAARKLQDAMAVNAVATPTGRAMLEVVDGLTQVQWGQLMREQPVTFSTQPTAGEQRLPGSIEERLRGASPGFPFPKSLFKTFGAEVEQALGKAEQGMKEQWGRANGYRVTVQLSLAMGAQPIGMLRVSPEPLGTEGMAALFAASGLNLVGAPTFFAPPSEDPAEREKRLAADPVLGKKAVLKLPPLQPQTGILAVLGSAHRVAEILPEVEAAFGVQLAGDAYNRVAMAVLAPMGDAEVPLYKVLDGLAGVTRTWERDGEVIRFRSRTWAHDRRSEIPARYMTRWLTARTRKGGFALEDLAEIAAMLRDEQVESLMYSALEAGTRELGDFIMVTGNRDVLRLYGKLLPAQRRRLLAGDAIPAGALFPYQQALLVRLNGGQKGSMLAMAFGAKPQRTLEQLAQSALTMEVVQPAPPAAPGDAAPPPAAPGAFGMMGGPGPVYTIRVSFPNGQKDEYRIPLSRPAPAAPPTSPQPAPPM